MFQEKRQTAVDGYRAAGGEVGDGFADHAVGDGSGDLQEGVTLFGGLVGVPRYTKTRSLLGFWNVARVSRLRK